ncbi:MAG TPA: hypothetical protein VGL02_18770 [Streptomyces sp.]
MEAGPRDNPPRRDTTAEPELPAELLEGAAVPEPHGSLEPFDELAPGDPLDSLDSLDRLEPLTTLEPFDGLEPLGALESGAALPPMEDGQSFRELRPQRRLRVWQLAPIIALAVSGSLMFAFPLAFESGDAGPVVAMLGLLLCCCSAGWALMAARRVGHTWPGLPARGSGARADWRYVAGYTAMIALLAVLAVWRVARLR